MYALRSAAAGLPPSQAALCILAIADGLPILFGVRTLTFLALPGSSDLVVQKLAFLLAKRDRGRLSLKVAYLLIARTLVLRSSSAHDTCLPAVVLPNGLHSSRLNPFSLHGVALQYGWIESPARVGAGRVGEHDATVLLALPDPSGYTR